MPAGIVSVAFGASKVSMLWAKPSPLATEAKTNGKSSILLSAKTNSNFSRFIRTPSSAQDDLHSSPAWSGLRVFQKVPSQLDVELARDLLHGHLSRPWLGPHPRIFHRELVEDRVGSSLRL